MEPDTFQLAVQRAQRACSPDSWINLEPRERTEVIYRELRRIDAARAAAVTQPRRRRWVRIAEPETVGGP